MGINAGIKVIRRITDEQRWKTFLQAVVEYFKNDARVCMEVKINLETNTVDHNRSSSASTFQPTSDLRLFHLTETFNFVPGDNSLLGFWNTMIPSEPADLHETESENQQPQLREATVTKLQSEVIRLNYTDVNIDKLVSRSYLHPTQAIVFHVGESPELPIYAHHFKAIESKLTCGGLMADVALEGVDKLLKQFFPGHTRYWSEFEEQKGFPDQDRTSSESQDETDQFYRKLIESVNKDDEIIAQAMKN